MKLNRHRHSNLPRTEHQHLFFGSLSRRKTQIAERSDRVTERSETQVMCRCGASYRARSWVGLRPQCESPQRSSTTGTISDGRDPYSASFYSQRQTAYAKRLGLASIYTPQMVVDGMGPASSMLAIPTKALGVPKDSCLFVVDLGRRLEYFARSRYTSANTSLLHPSTLVRTVSSRRRHISNEVGRRETRAYS